MIIPPMEKLLELREMVYRREVFSPVVDAAIQAAFKYEDGTNPEFIKGWTGEWVPHVSGRITLMTTNGLKGPNFAATALTRDLDDACNFLEAVFPNQAYVVIGGAQYYDGPLYSANIGGYAKGSRTRALGVLCTIFAKLTQDL